MTHISSLQSLYTAIADILSKGVVLTLRKVLFDSRVTEECKEQLCKRETRARMENRVNEGDTAGSVVRKQC